MQQQGEVVLFAISNGQISSVRLSSELSLLKIRLWKTSMDAIMLLCNKEDFVKHVNEITSGQGVEVVFVPGNEYWLPPSDADATRQRGLGGVCKRATKDNETALLLGVLLVNN
ncbi:hypothetical protein Tco_1274676 [Tanacetum coccineum]